MITVTTPSAINPITPATEGVANLANNLTTNVTSPNEGFTTALNAQLNLVSPAVTADATLVAQTALLTATTVKVPTEVATNLSTTTLTTQQPAVLSETTLPTSGLSATQTTESAPTVLPVEIMTTGDSEVLSNVTDTLKFIATGSKLGDTLKTAQSVQLSTANFATPLTQQTVQSAVPQALTNKQVNTPATVLAQQATPVQAVQTGMMQQTPVLENLVQPNITVQQAIVNQLTVSSTPVQNQTQIAAMQVQTLTTSEQVEPTQILATTPQVETTENTVTVVTKQAQTVSTQPSAIQQAQSQSLATATSSAQATSVTEQMESAKQEPVAIQSQAVPAQLVQVKTAEKPVVAESTLQVLVSPQQTTADNAQIPTLITNTKSQTSVATTQVQTPVVTSSQTAPITTQVAEQASVQTVAVQQTTSVELAQVQTQTQQSAEKPTAQTTITQSTRELETATSAIETTVVAEKIQQPVAQSAATKSVEKTSMTKTAVDASVVTEAGLQTAEQNFVKDEMMPTSSAQNFVESEKPKAESEHHVELVVQKPVEENVMPIVTAQSVPVQVEAESASFDAPSSNVSEEKPTLTPAKTLLADMLASRNSGGDMAGNSGDKKGSDTPANPMLQADSLLKSTTAENKQGLDTKSFASLLNSEKSDLTSTTTTVPTADKTTAQVATAAVNKLAQDMKVEVPALTRPLSHPQWNQEVGERIVWMNNQGISSAEIKMNPQNMGPITVRIDMNQDQASIAFTAQNGDVRNALEASIPKLREMLSSQNLNLADVNVSQQSSTNADSGRSQQQAAQMTADASANGQGNRQSNQEVDVEGNPIRQVNVNGEETLVSDLANGHELANNGTNGLLSLYA